MQCKRISNTLRCLFYVESCLLYIGEVLTQIWLKSMSELLDKQVYVLNECVK